LGLDGVSGDESIAEVVENRALIFVIRPGGCLSADRHSSFLNLSNALITTDTIKPQVVNQTLHEF